MSLKLNSFCSFALFLPLFYPEKGNGVPSVNLGFVSKPGLKFNSGFASSLGRKTENFSERVLRSRCLRGCSLIGAIDAVAS